jgi:hypothetical protein
MIGPGSDEAVFHRPTDSMTNKTPNKAQVQGPAELLKEIAL